MAFRCFCECGQVINPPTNRLKHAAAQRISLGIIGAS